MQLENSIREKIYHILRIDRALRLVWESSRGWTLASVALVTVQGVLPLLSLFLLKLIIDAISSAFIAPENSIEFSEIAILIGFGALVALINSFLESISNLVDETQGQIVTNHVQSVLHTKSIEIDLEYYENSQYYDTLHRAQQEAPYRPTLILDDLLSIGRSLVSLIAISSLIVFSLHWSYALILFASVIPGILIRLKYADKMYQWQRRRTSKERRVDYLNWLLTGSWHAKEIRMFTLGPLFKERSQKLREQLRLERFNIAKKQSLIQLIAQIGQVGAVFALFVAVSYRAVQGSITIGDLVMLFQAFQRIQGSMQDIMGGLADLYENNLFLSNFYEFLAIKPKIIEPVKPVPFRNPVQEGIVFEKVSFNYPNTDRKALEDINLVIRPGELVAVVGKNGAGKTTLIKLLCRLYDPTGGRISIDGIDLRSISITDLRRHISVIFQDFAQYQLTARENIWLGDIRVSPNNGRIVKAAHHCGADTFISQLPNGYDTMLGKWFEDGEEISYGEWQKVALARTLIKDAQICILDEPTSHIDAIAENELVDVFQKIKENRTVLLISHRMSTVKKADRIFVMDSGRITASGTHNELLQKGDLYANLFERQAQHYQQRV